MQITFDTTTITDDEVRGIFALLDTVCPKAFDPGPFDAEEVTRAVEEKLSGAGISVAKDENGNTVTTLSAEGFVIPNPEGANFPNESKIIPRSPDTDANGIRWDERIHSGTKALNADGTWRTKRGVDKALVASVEATLREQASYDSDVTPEAVQQMRDAAAPALENADLEQIDPPVSAPTPPAPPAPEAPLSVSAPVESENSAPTPPSWMSPTSPFVALMKRVTTAQGAGKLTGQRVKELLESLDKKSIMDLRTDTDALDAFAVLLDGEGV